MTTRPRVPTKGVVVKPRLKLEPKRQEPPRLVPVAPRRVEPLQMPGLTQVRP